MNDTAPAAGPKPKKSVALSGVAAGNTALCTVGRTGNDLAYRGYDILECPPNGARPLPAPEYCSEKATRSYVPPPSRFRSCYRFKDGLRAPLTVPAHLR